MSCTTPAVVAVCSSLSLLGQPLHRHCKRLTSSLATLKSGVVSSGASEVMAANRVLRSTSTVPLPADEGGGGRRCSRTPRAVLVCSRTLTSSRWTSAGRERRRGDHVGANCCLQVSALLATATRITSGCAVQGVHVGSHVRDSTCDNGAALLTTSTSSQLGAQRLNILCSAQHSVHWVIHDRRVVAPVLALDQQSTMQHAGDSTVGSCHTH